jgi:hypothetical protein
MTASATPGIYLCVDFDWPQPFQPEYGQKAKKLHDAVQDRNWIREVVAASGGIGAGPSSTWIFWLANYAALDKLLHNRENDVSQAYHDFFSQMPTVVDKIREEVLFL